MNCQQYLALFSDHHDGTLGEELGAEMDAHRSGCSRCAEYARTLEAGVGLLRSLPLPELSSDFRPRLDHRIYHVEDGPSIAREALGTGATTASVLAMAVLLALVAWSPGVKRPEPPVHLPAVVVQSPPAPTFTPRAPGPTFSRGLSLLPSTDFQDGFWGDAHQLLFEFSTLSEKRRSSAFAGVAIE